MWAKLPTYYVGESFVRLIPFKDHINIEAKAVPVKTPLKSEPLSSGINGVFSFSRDFRADFGEKFPKSALVLY